MGKSTISMAIFNSYVKLPEGKHIETVILERTKICGPSHGTCVTLERFTLLVVHSTPLWSACSDALVFTWK
jgi:hypothetical protein